MLDLHERMSYTSLLTGFDFYFILQRTFFKIYDFRMAP